MTQGAKKSEGGLAAAAGDFERALDKYERIAAELARTEVSSEKTLSRSKKLLSESTECEQELGELLGALLRAMNAARETQQGAMEKALDAARRMQVRAGELNALLARFSTLGQQAREVNAPAAEVMQSHAEGVPDEQLLPTLNDVSARMASVIGEADALAEAAKGGNWPDLVREASALRDQMQAARNRVLLAQREVAERAAS